MKLKYLIQQLKEFSTNCDWGEETEVYLSDPCQGDCENLADIRIVGDDRYPALVLFPDDKKL